ncbi:WD40 repeat [Dillenia turbinata]|uniref:WD40 repeat n=1 Tax=Dillenia turbinata TaxID=194707 RepID=A0AAN8W120_9MAGN
MTGKRGKQQNRGRGGKSNSKGRGRGRGESSQSRSQYERRQEKQPYIQNEPLAEAEAEPVINDEYEQWKTTIPVLYDWFANHNLVWPSLSCRWGPVVQQATYKNKQRLYLCEQANKFFSITRYYLSTKNLKWQTDGTVPNTLVVATVEVVKPRVAAAQHISKFSVDARSPYVKKHKTILHPGEVNRIRELPQCTKILATHTDIPEVLIWDVEAQPNRQGVPGATPSRPNLILTGHQDVAEYALGMCLNDPFVLSGGKDKLVVLWSIADHVSTAASNGSTTRSSGSDNMAAADGEGSSQPQSVGPRGIFQGHEDAVEDVCFHPTSGQEFCSVGDDSCLILWDARCAFTPCVKVEKAHDADIHCVDWNPHDENLILTGSADHSVCMFDRRNLISSGVGSPVHKFEGHSAAVLCVQWSPNRTSAFGSGAEDKSLNIWDYEKVGQKIEDDSPEGLFFRHCGHRDKVVDFHWNPSDPWTIASVSDEVSLIGGGGTVQIWRIIDLLTRPEDEVLAELDGVKSHILGGC